MKNKKYYQAYFQLYPKGEIQDFIKLLYQATLGSAHLISNIEENYKRLEDEYNYIEHDDNHLLYEEISDKLLRVHLEAIRKDELKKYHQLFLQSIDITSSKEEFINILNEVEIGIQEGWIPFEINKWQKEKQEYIDKGCPVISHSEIFRELYHPHYRLMKRELAIC